MTLLAANGISVSFGGVKAVQDVSFAVDRGQVFSIVGPNGAGKTTIFNLISRIYDVDQGSIVFDGRDISRMAPAKVVRLGIGYAPERGNLFPFMGVRENLLVGAYRKRDEIEANLRTVFDLFPRLEERQNQETATQSGGERQMASLGRALMSSPRLLMVDEPTLGLAPRVCLEIAAVLRDLNQRLGLTIVITEQNVNFAMSLAQEVYLLETGRIGEARTPDQLRESEDIATAYFGD